MAVRDTDQDLDKNLDDILPKFKAIYLDELGLYQECVERVIGDLEYILSGSSIKHVPVTGRVKRWESIGGTGLVKGTVQRRQENRLDLQTAKKNMANAMRVDIAEVEDEWESYCRTFKLAKDAVGHFRDVEEARNAIHDINGCRIALYFPNDVRRVGEVLNGAGYSDDQLSKRMGGPDDVKALREKLGKRIKEETRIDDLEAFETKGKQFSGYGAVHLVKRIPERLTRGQSDWSDLRVEIQVGTVLMHAWSEVEHDIIYKIHGSKPTDDEMAYLDIVNGLVLAGEVALRRFKSPPPLLGMEVQGRKANDPASLGQSIADPAGRAAYPVNTRTVATFPEADNAESLQKFHNWFFEYYAIHNRQAPQEWFGLDQLFNVLMVTNGSVRHNIVLQLMDSSRRAFENPKTADIFDHVLPLLMLDRLCDTREDFPSANAKGLEHARILSAQFVEAHNLAESLGCTNALSAYFQWQRDNLADQGFEHRVTILDFLDMLHPLQPCCNQGKERILVDFCTALLQEVPLTLPILENVKVRSLSDGQYKSVIAQALLAKLAVRLSRKGYSALAVLRPGSTLDSSTESVIIPGNLGVNYQLPYDSLNQVDKKAGDYPAVTERFPALSEVTHDHDEITPLPI